MFLYRFLSVVRVLFILHNHYIFVITGPISVSVQIKRLLKTVENPNIIEKMASKVAVLWKTGS